MPPGTRIVRPLVKLVNCGILRRNSLGQGHEGRFQVDFFLAEPSQGVATFDEQFGEEEINLETAFMTLTKGITS